MRESYRSRLNENVVTIMASDPSGTELTIASDIAQVVDDGDNLRVLPIVGKGVAQNVKDVMFMRGIDMAITQANVLKYYARTGELGSNFIDQVVYVAKLFNEEVHFVVPLVITDIKQLSGQVVNLGLPGSGTAITGRLLLEALGIKVQELHLSRRRCDREAQARRDRWRDDSWPASRLRPWDISRRADGLKLLSIPLCKELEDSYYPATSPMTIIPSSSPRAKAWIACRSARC